MIVVFSGTGNSLYVADNLGRLLGDSVVSLPHSGSMPPAGERVVWVMPVYSWGVPPVVCRWIKEMDFPGAADARHSLVVTCGDDTGTTDRQWRRLLEQRGWKGTDAWSVQMPNTYVLMKGFDVDSDALATEKIAKAGPRIEHIARLIASRTGAGDAEPVSDLVRGSFATLKSRVVYPWFIRFAMSPEPFHANAMCVGCGICARSCPLGNITMGDDRRPCWGNNCALCLRCYHACPHNAVAYSTVTRGKGRKKQLLELVVK